MAATEAKLRQRRDHGGQDNSKKSLKSESREPEQTKKSKYAAAHDELRSATSSTKHRLWTRTVIIVAVMTLVYFYTKNQSREKKFALVHENLPLRMAKFQCSEAYEAEMKDYPQCVPKKCGRFVADKLVEPKEVEVLLDLARRVIGKAGSTGGASILDIHTGALSYEKAFVNVFSVPKLLAEFSEEHLRVYNFVKGKIKLAIADKFGIPADSLYLTYPTFFSHFTNTTAQTMHDEYWHEHVDKETYPSFHYTSLLYLNTYNKDFSGGRFIFVDGSGDNRTTTAIEPKMGRLSAFTSGSENRHHVEKVTSGERYAVTISFTCNQELGISDPKIKTQE